MVKKVQAVCATASLAAVGAMVLAGCGGGNDDAAATSSATATSSAHPAPTKAAGPTSSTEPAETTSASSKTSEPVDNVTAGERIAKKLIKKKIGLSGIGFPCNWKEQENDAGLVYMTACVKDEILLAASSDHADVQDWVHGMKDKVNDGYWILGGKYALTTTDQGTANRLWDLLGAKDDRGSF